MSQRALSRQFTTVLPRRTALQRVVPERFADAPLRRSENGESGPGVYTTDDPGFAGRMATGQTGDSPSMAKTTLNLRTTHSLRMLDRSKPGGEEFFRQAEQTGGRTQLHETLAAAGFHGVLYDSFGDRETVVHDPAKLKVVKR